MENARPADVAIWADESEKKSGVNTALVILALAVLPLPMY